LNINCIRRDYGQRGSYLKDPLPFQWY
jgi:hypothetical protein